MLIRRQFRLDQVTATHISNFGNSILDKSNLTSQTSKKNQLGSNVRLAKPVENPLDQMNFCTSISQISFSFQNTYCVQGKFRRTIICACICLIENENNNQQTIIPSELPLSECITDHSRKNCIFFSKNRQTDWAFNSLLSHFQ